MLKKIERAQQLLKKEAAVFRCPTCHEPMHVEGVGLICQQRHQFDLSKKGTLYFLNHGVQTEYNKKMFTSRGKMIQSGMYAPVLNKIMYYLPQNKTVVDVGCGEGSFLAELSQAGLSGLKIGFDLSKEGIYLASNQPIDAFWCVAHLTNLPFANEGLDTILNIFSPSHYQEFRRVLKADGTVIKIIPEENYLKELRAAFYPNDEKKQSYSNQKVVQRFAEELAVEVDERITYCFDIPEERRLDLLEMSPLEWQVSQEVKAKLQQRPLEKITIDVRLLVGRKR